MSERQELIDRRCLAFSGKDGLPSCQWVGTSGAHLEGYFCLDPASPDLRFLRKLARKLIAPFIGQGIDVVATPATGSLPLNTMVTDELQNIEGRFIASIWADKEGPHGQTQFVINRPTFAEHLHNKKALLVEDYINRQYTADKLISVMHDIGGEVVGVTTVGANSNVNAKSLKVPRFHSLCEVAYKVWSPKECAAQGPCSRLEPFVVDPGLGHGAEYKAAHPDYQGGFITILS